MKYTSFEEHQFRRSVDKAVEQARAILGTAKNPRMAAEQDHTYQDKFALAEFVTHSEVTSVHQVLQLLGLDQDKLATVLKWVQEDQKTVTLSFRAEDSCSFLKETVVEQHMDRAPVLTKTSTTTETTQKPELVEGWQDTSDGNNPETKTTTTTESTHVVQKVKQHHWNVNVHYAIAVYPGNDTASALELQSRNTTVSIMTLAGMAHSFDQETPPSTPIPQHTIHNPVEMDLTWLLQNIKTTSSNDSSDVVCQFSIDRTQSGCKTPRRNEPVDAAVKFSERLSVWAGGVQKFFRRRLDQQILAKDQSTDGSRLPRIALSDNIYEPIAPWMEENGSVLKNEDAEALMTAHLTSMQEVCSKIIQTLPSSQLGDNLMTSAETILVVLCDHIKNLAQQYKHSINYIEGMLSKQLIQAIGKQVNSQDFETFIRHHNQKLFGSAYAPKPFTRAIRRPGHYPDGILSIEANRGDPDNRSIETMVRHIKGTENPSIFMPINAATSVEITGDRYLHGWIQHRFESEVTPEHAVVARARQFSSFLVVLGNMAGPNRFSPKHAIILQNKDEVMIPLLMEVLPTAQEFKDAISSLSPEQQEFAKAYRGMQLESSVFGICVIQLKPQMEKLLGLPAGALTKEIKLTQNLMSLFVNYQIPSDLLSFDGHTEVDVAAKLETVKCHVKSVLDVIDTAKEKQLMEEKQKQEMREQRMETARQETRKRSAIGMPMNFSLEGYGGGSFGGSTESMNEMQLFHRGGGVEVYGGGGDGMAAPFGAVAERKRMASSPRMASAAAAFMPALGVEDCLMAAADDSAMAPPAPPQESGSAPQTERDSSKMDQTNEENLQSSSDVEMAEGDDFTLIPKILDAKVEALDSDNALKSTILKAGPTWTRKRQENLLTKLETKKLASGEIDNEKNKAFDLLDALSRSGALSIDCAELHVVVALSHCFENDVMGTIIQDNINPIVKAERSALIVGSTIHDEPSQILLHGNSNTGRLQSTFPALFIETD